MHAALHDAGCHCVSCRYSLNLYSIQLLHMTPELTARVPPSDTRRRWDLRAMEQGRFAEVSNSILMNSGIMANKHDAGWRH